VLKTRPRNVEETLLQLINDDDPVVAAAAIDLVREKEIWSLTDDVEFVLAHRDVTDWYVFEAASWTLASRRLTSDRRRELWLEPLPAVALVARLRGIPMFASVGIDELFRIAGTGHQTRHEAATTLFQEGTVPDVLYVLLDGRIVSTARRGTPHEISPPVTLGFEEVLNGHLMSHTVKTLEPCVTLRLGTDEMRTLLADNIDLVQGFFRTLAGRGAPERAAVIKGNLDTALIRPVGEPLTPIQKVLAMQRVPVFSRMSAIEMRHLAAIAHQFELEADAVVSGNTDAPMVYVVLSGALSLEVPDTSVPPIPAGPGDVIGLLAARAGQDGEAGAEPRRPVVAQAGSALRIDRHDLYDLLGQRPDLLQQIFSVLFGKRSRA
jgi:CRP-like cAMP-binding protein